MIAILLLLSLSLVAIQVANVNLFAIPQEVASLIMPQSPHIGQFFMGGNNKCEEQLSSTIV